MYNYNSSTKKRMEHRYTREYNRTSRHTVRGYIEDRKKIPKEVKFELKYGKVQLTKKRRQYKCLAISLLQNVMANIWWYILPVILLSIYKHVCVYICMYLCVIIIISLHKLKCIRHSTFIFYSNTHNFHFVISFHGGD